MCGSWLVHKGMLKLLDWRKETCNLHLHFSYSGIPPRSQNKQALIIMENVPTHRTTWIMAIGQFDKMLDNRFRVTFFSDCSMNMMHGQTAEPIRELLALGEGGRRALICNQRSSKKNGRRKWTFRAIQTQRSHDANAQTAAPCSSPVIDCALLKPYERGSV